jgi:hypothetical protein
MMLTARLLAGRARDLADALEDLAEHLEVADGTLTLEEVQRLALVLGLPVIEGKVSAAGELLASLADPKLLTMHSEGRERGRKASQKAEGYWQRAEQ